ANVDAIQDLFVLRRHFGEKPYVVNARSPSFAAPAQITPEEAGELKQTLDQHRARHHWIFTEMVIKHPSHRRQIFSSDCVATPEFSSLGAYLSNASSGGLGSFGVLSPNNVPSLQRINSERSKKEFCMG